MKITSLRTGTDAGSPGTNAHVVELVLDGIVYVTLSVFDEFERVTITDKPIFDIWFSDEPGVLEYPLSGSLEDYESIEDAAGSDYADAVRTAIDILGMCRKGIEPEELNRIYVSNDV